MGILVIGFLLGGKKELAIQEPENSSGHALIQYSQRCNWPPVSGFPGNWSPSSEQMPDILDATGTACRNGKAAGLIQMSGLGA